MADLIDRAAALALQYWEGCGNIKYGVVCTADIEALPAVDAVEVVRCGKCKHADTIGTLYCFYWARNTVEDGYCHEGV